MKYYICTRLQDYFSYFSNGYEFNIRCQFIKLLKHKFDKKDNTDDSNLQISLFLLPSLTLCPRV